MFEIKNGRLLGVPFVNANASGGTLKPTLIILHDTAGRLTKGSSVSWFRSKECTTSAHVVIERDGTITQMVPFNKRAWHAGQSAWQGKKLCNSFAIGIEIVNPGMMERRGDEVCLVYRDGGKDRIVDRYALNDCFHVSTPEHGRGWCLPYTPEQICAVKELCRTLVAAYPEVNDIATHWQVSPGRKVDPCPLFPLQEVEDFAFGRSDPETIDNPPVAIKPAEKVPENMAQSTEGLAALGSGGIGTASIGNEIGGAMTKVVASGKAVTFGEFLLQLATSGTFWGSLLLVGLSAYIWLRRRRRLLQGG